jgi:3-phenylpropionate/trans-cinnamate dioxygenase ferredoxin component
MAEFRKAATISEVSPGTAKRVEINATPVALFNINGSIYAINDVCTHRECSLSEGFIEGDTVTCPCHMSVFDVKTGKVLEPPALLNVASYKVRVQNGDIEVEV